MANEFNVSYSLSLLNGNSKYVKQIGFRPSQTTNNGPTPGAITATTGGVTLSLAQLTTPGLAAITNIDATNYVQIGLYISSTFYPFLDLLPGESFPIRLARDILTANAGAAVIRLKANTASVIVTFDAFDK